MSVIEIVPLAEAVTGPCSCCNEVTHHLRGEVRRDGARHAVYYVRWIAERLDEHSEWLIDIEGDPSGASDERCLVALRCRSHRHWPAFMVVDAARKSWGKQVAPGGRDLAATDVVGQAIAAEAYAVVDQVLVQDPRVRAQFAAMAAAEPTRWRRWLSDRRRRRAARRRKQVGPHT
jgi:hypothetical protein